MGERTEVRGISELTDVERKVIGDAIGQIVTFFINMQRAACAERDEAIARAEKAERWLARLQKPDGEVRESNVSAAARG